jgi:hypothetical protein
MEQHIATAPAMDPGVPHIDGLNVHEQDTPNGLVIWQEIVFHAADGDVTRWQNELIDTSTPAPRINLMPGGAIAVSKAQQIKGAFVNTAWNCGPARSKYWFIKRMTLVDAMGRHSNSVDVRIACH